MIFWLTGLCFQEPSVVCLRGSHDALGFCVAPRELAAQDVGLDFDASSTRTTLLFGRWAESKVGGISERF